ncbi:homologous recombination OB-fold protein isoform X2 [Caloenas nicobarica]|uniref:homologous recombination OB-fold protein isoform X2 n=1 Tax=Caloenas nicobarica TaxID=187106 RepID=UPI0032B7600E
MAGHLQKLFGADGDLADEDFLSAVEDAENQFMVPGRLSPGGGSVPPSLQPLRPLGPQLGHCPGKTPGLRPLARQGEQPGGCRGPPAGAAARQDELDNELFLAACMELEGPEAPVGAGAARPPPRRWEKPPETRAGQESPPARAAPKKLRVGEELVSPGCGGGEHRQDPLPAPQAAPASRLVLRPSTAGAGPSGLPTPLGKPGGSWASSPTARRPAPRPLQVSPCQLGASSSSVGLQVPQLLPTNPPALMSSVEPPPRQPPRPPLGSLQTPVVTNHLVQLVTAASKAPGAAPRLPPQGSTRRFPGPAGILPQQWEAPGGDPCLHPPNASSRGCGEAAVGGIAQLLTTHRRGFWEGALACHEDRAGAGREGPWLLPQDLQCGHGAAEGSLEAAPEEQGPQHGCDDQDADQDQCRCRCRVQGPDRRDAGDSASPAAGREAERAQARLSAAPEAGQCLLPIPPQPLPQRHPQQPAQDLPTRAREQLPAAIASTAGGPGWAAPGPPCTAPRGCPCPWGLGTIRNRQLQHRAVSWGLLPASAEPQAQAR